MDIKRLLCLLAGIIVLCSMSECQKESIMTESNAIDFTLTRDGEDNGIFFYAPGYRVMSANCSDGKLNIDCSISNQQADFRLSCRKFNISMQTDSGIIKGHTYSSGDKGTSLTALLTYTSNGARECQCTSLAGTLKPVIITGNYIAGTFSFEFDIPLYNEDGTLDETVRYQLNDGFFSVYYR